MKTFWFTIAISLLSAEFAPADDTIPSIDAHKVAGYKQCSKCHQAEIDVWKNTPHHTTFDTLHRRPEAKKIAQKLGLKSIKRNDVCVQCHYTRQHRNGKIKPISGVSCESCHGAASDWLEIHHDYGGPDATREDETPAHRRRRREAAMARGMRNPVNLYLVAQSCLACHTTPNEQLVNVGGHPAGSGDFELVAWSQGKVRHNFSRSGGNQNEVSSRDRLRLMYLVGTMTDLEYSLRATSRATSNGPYGVASARRADRLRRHLQAMQKQLAHPLVQQAIDAAFSAKLKANNRAALTTAADVVGQAAYAVADNVDGSQLVAVDTWLPDPTRFK